MKFGWTIALLLLMGAVLSSSLASTLDPCGGHNGRIDSAHIVEQNLSGQHHGSGQENPAEGTCCDDCAVACAMSGCNPVAAAFSSIESSFEGEIRFVPFVIVLHDEPVILPLFRPPILAA